MILLTFAALQANLFIVHKMNTLEFLRRAERYCEARGDENWFKNLYSGFREYNNVEDSVWKTLSYLYDNETADFVHNCYWGI